MTQKRHSPPDHPQRAVIGFPTAIATAVGLIMASPVILTVMSGFGLGGKAFAFAIGIAFVVMQAQAVSFAEAAGILPTTGSVYDYISCGLGRFCAITGTISAYLLVHVFAGTAETVLSGVMALANFSVLNARLQSAGGSWLVGVGMVLIFAVTNALGVRVYSRMEIVLTAGMWTTLMIFGVCGLAHPAAVHLDGWFGGSSIGTTPAAVLSLIGTAMFMFVGFEFVTPLATELRDPSRQIPRAMRLGLVAVALCMLVFGAAIRHQVANVAVNTTGTIHLLDTPDAVPRFAERVMGPFGRIWLGIGLLFAGAATINTLMAGLPRILYGMALDGALPRIFAYLHPRLKTPVVAIGVSAAIPCLHAWLIHGDVDRLANLVLAAVCAWSVSYLLVTLSVMLLRARRPDLPRPYRAPWFPIPQIVSIVGIVIALIYIAPAGTSARAVYEPFGMMLGFTALYALIWTRFVQRAPLFEPASIEQVLAEESGGVDGLRSATGPRPIESSMSKSDMDIV